MQTSLSAETTALVTRLGEPRRLFGRIRGRVRDLSIIDRLGSSGEWPVVRFLTPFAFSAHDDVAHQTARAIHRLVQGAEPAQLLELSEWMRDQRETGSEPLTPDDVARASAHGEEYASVFGVTSLHSNGFIREAALRRVAEQRSGDEIPFVLLRAKDWVSEIRQFAQETIAKRLQPEYAPAYARYFLLVERLARGEDVEARETADAIFRLLATEAGEPTLHALCNSPQPALRRRAYELMCTNSSTGLEGLRQAAADRHPVVRRWAYSKAVSFPPSAERNDFVLNARRDRDTVIRWLAFHELAASGNEYRYLMRDFLLDPAPALRAAAQRLAIADGVLTLPAFYRRIAGNHASPRRAAAAVAGLVETGDASEAPFVLTLLGHEAPRVRQAALRALATWKISAVASLARDRLLSDVGAVGRQASTILRGRITPFEYFAFWQAAVATGNPQLRNRVIRIAPSLPIWEHLEALLLAVGVDQAPSPQALHLLTHWNRRAKRQRASLGPEFRARLEELIHAVRARVDPGLHRDLVFAVRFSS